MESLNKKDQSFEEMSKSFQMAFGYSNNEYYQQSLPLYEKAMQEDNNNFAALNNMGVAKIYLGIKSKDKSLIEKAILDLKDAIRITREIYNYPDGYPIAEANLAWAEEEMVKLTD